MTTLYYVEYPRDFANEYNVFAVAPNDRRDFEAARPNAERITRREAIRLAWSRVREAKRDGEQWFGGFFSDTVYHTCDTLAESLGSCRMATANLVDQHRASLACW